jgi:hypothetical protein
MGLLQSGLAPKGVARRRSGSRGRVGGSGPERERRRSECGGRVGRRTKRELLGFQLLALVCPRSNTHLNHTHRAHQVSGSCIFLVGSARHILRHPNRGGDCSTFGLSSAWGPVPGGWL